MLILDRMLSKVSLKISNCITIRLKMLTFNLEDFLSCKRGYHLKRHDWLNGSINIIVEVNKENYAHGSDLTAEKTEFLTWRVSLLE